MERVATTDSSLEADQDSGNINRTQSMATLNDSFPQETDSGSGPKCQDTILGGAKAKIRFEAASKLSNDPHLLRVNTLRSREDNMKLKELMEFFNAVRLNLLMSVLVYAARHTLTAVMAISNGCQHKIAYAGDDAFLGQLKSRVGPVHHVQVLDLMAPSRISRIMKTLVLAVSTRVSHPQLHFGNPCQVKYATCTLLDGALTWWNAYVQYVGLDATYEITWKNLKKMMIEEYCPRNEVQKMETELWNLSVNGTDIIEDIKGNVTSSKPTKIQDAIRMAHDLMDQTMRAKAAKGVDNKRKCTLHHSVPCTVQCKNYKKISHLTRDCRAPTLTAPATTQRTSVTFFECGVKGHFKIECLKLKNQGRRNQNGCERARGIAFVSGEGEARQDPNVVTGRFFSIAVMLLFYSMR
ncbi:putative reverse transcriptase domain-containing protein, partial [Tanacetum coccineum]